MVITPSAKARGCVQAIQQLTSEETHVVATSSQALAQLRAPIYEEKVVDHIVALAKVTDKTVSKEELFKVEDEVVKA